jgi:hypothetical protein
MLRRGPYRILVASPKVRRPFGRPRHRWEDNIKIGLREVGWGMDWIELAQDRDKWRALVNSKCYSIHCNLFIGFEILTAMTVKIHVS